MWPHTPARVMPKIRASSAPETPHGAARRATRYLRPLSFRINLQLKIQRDVRRSSRMCQPADRNKIDTRLRIARTVARVTPPLASVLALPLDEPYSRAKALPPAYCQAEYIRRASNACCTCSSVVRFHFDFQLRDTAPRARRTAASIALVAPVARGQVIVLNQNAIERPKR